MRGGLTSVRQRACRRTILRRSLAPAIAWTLPLLYACFPRPVNAYGCYAWAGLTVERCGLTGSAEEGWACVVFPRRPTSVCLCGGSLLPHRLREGEEAPAPA